MRPLILRTQNDLANEIISHVGDPDGDGLWSLQQVYSSLNGAIAKWSERVFLPRLYSLADGFANGTWNYALPRYIRGPVDVQIQRTVWPVNQPPDESNNSRTWSTIYSGFIEPSDSGDGADFRFHSMPYTQSGRIRWYVVNGPIPYGSEQPLLNAAIDDDDDELVIQSQPRIGVAGWVNVGAEYISYADFTYETDGTTTLHNLGRGVGGTVASSHSADDDVQWTVGADSEMLWEQLFNQAYANMHSFYLHAAGINDRQSHQQNVNYFQQQADTFWRIYGYAPDRDIVTHLDQTALGNMPWS